VISTAYSPCKHIVCEVLCSNTAFRISKLHKAAINTKKKKNFTSKLDLNLRKKLAKCYIWNMGSVVATATGYGLDGPGIESRWG
jgi:hypothetical protein